VPLLHAIHTLDAVGTTYFSEWRYASGWSFYDGYKLDFMSTSGRIDRVDHAGVLTPIFRVHDGWYLLSSEDEFFDFGTFAVYTSVYNDWIILANSPLRTFTVPDGFKGHTGMAQYSPQEFNALYGLSPR
jgi:hypothetical protein